MHRLYFPNFNSECHEFIVDDQQEVHHCARVLRLEVGARVEFFNGDGLDGLAVIEHISSKEIKLRVENVIDHRAKTRCKIILACAVPKNAKFDDIVDKCTQCGVDAIIPLQTQRTEVVWKSDRAQKKIERFESIALSAAKQSKRAFLPKIYPVTCLENFIKSLPQEAVILLPYLGSDERQALLQVLGALDHPEHIVLLIGPEGDFTQEEIKLLENKAVPITLGPNVLRVDTAAVAAVAAVHFVFRS